MLLDRPRLVRGDRLWAFTFGGWDDPVPRPTGRLTVLTPPTSVLALAHGFVPELRGARSAFRGWG